MEGNDNAATIRYVLKRHFKNDLKILAEESGISVTTLKKYISGQVNPNHGTVENILHLAYTPEFFIICEFKKTPPNMGKSWISETLGEHANSSGIYAFYDSMAKLTYLGKASTNLSGEIYSSVTRKHTTKMPSGINDISCQRRDVIHYISAYSIKAFDLWDYTRHVESLLLRISRPPMNKISGSLAKAYRVNR